MLHYLGYCFTQYSFLIRYLTLFTKNYVTIYTIPFKPFTYTTGVNLLKKHLQEHKAKRQINSFKHCSI